MCIQLVAITHKVWNYEFKSISHEFKALYSMPPNGEMFSSRCYFIEFHDIMIEGISGLLKHEVDKLERAGYHTKI